MNLTREQIKKLNGLELSDAVALHVMGWRQVPHAIINGRDAGQCWWKEDYGDPLSPAPGANPFLRPRFAIDIDLAWQVVEKLLPLRCSILRGAGMGNTWRTEFFEEETGRRLGEAVATEAPLAICRAALMVVAARK